MFGLVTIKNGLPVTTTLAIAEGTEVQHKNVIELVRTYVADLEKFGRVTFETRPFETNGGTQQREVAILNERQSTLIISYMKNTEIVRAFKIKLVTKFYEMAEELRNKIAVPKTQLEVLQDVVTAMGILTGQVPDPRFGQVNTYPKSVLDEVFKH